MEKLREKSFHKKDWILLILILFFIILAAIYFFTFLKPGNKVRVLKDNQVIDEYSLNENINKTYTFDGEENTLVIKDGKADVISANCKNQICVNTNPVSEVGETIACLPHGLIIEVVTN